MKKYLLVDLQNCMMRSRYAAHHGADIDVRIGLALHITLAGILKVFKQHSADHVVFCTEGRSWRKDFDQSYKANRTAARKKETLAEREEMQIFFEMINDFINFVKTKTNCTVLNDSHCEADDFVARWVQTHPDDHHIIISSDKDFHQLIAENVHHFDPVAENTYTLDGVFNSKGAPATNSKGEELPIPEPDKLLFVKCIRGDSGDNVFPAYFRAPMKSTKNRVGINEAYEDKDKKGYAWNSFMNHRWTHHDGSERIVKKEYEKNQILVDLTRQPDWIKERMDDVINESENKEKVSMIGVHFLRFCTKYELTTIENNSQDYINFLSKGLK